MVFSTCFVLSILFLSSPLQPGKIKNGIAILLILGTALLASLLFFLSGRTLFARRFILGYSLCYCAVFSGVSGFSSSHLYVFPGLIPPGNHQPPNVPETLPFTAFSRALSDCIPFFSISKSFGALGILYAGAISAHL